MNKLTLATAVVASLTLATSAEAAINLTSGTSYSWSVDYTPTTGGGAGASGTIYFNYTGTTGNTWNFTYTVDNTSVAPSADSQIVAFGMNTTPNAVSVTNGSGDLFTAGLDQGNFNGLGTFDLCLWAGSNCNGGAGNGVTVADGNVSGSFSLTYASSMNTLTLSDFVMRWQALENGGSASGPGTPGVPEPATWAMFIFGFSAVGYTLRRRKAYRIAQAV